MAEDAETGRETREYAVLVHERELTWAGWRELGSVEALNRRAAKDAAVAKWPDDMTPANGREVVAQFVPARSWQAAIGKHDQAPAPPPKITWDNL